jgi:hypothetical protein
MNSMGYRIHLLSKTIYTEGPLRDTLSYRASMFKKFESRSAIHLKCYPSQEDDHIKPRPLRMEPFSIFASPVQAAPLWRSPQENPPD